MVETTDESTTTDSVYDTDVAIDDSIKDESSDAEEADFVAVTSSVLSLEEITGVDIAVLIVPDPFLISDDERTKEELALAVELEEITTDVVLPIISSLDELIRDGDDDLINEVFSDSVTVGMILGMKLLTNSEELETDFVAVTGSKPDVINSELSLEDMMEVEALVLILPDPFFVSNEDRTVIELALAVELEELTTDVVLLITWSLDEPIKEIDDDLINEVFSDSVMVGMILGMKLLTDSEEFMALDVTNDEVTLTGIEYDIKVDLVLDASCVWLVLSLWSGSIIAVSLDEVAMTEDASETEDADTLDSETGDALDE